MIPEDLRKIIHVRLDEFSCLPNEKWQREIMLCLLTPQSRPQNAEKCMADLERNGFFRGALSESEVAAILRNPTQYVRFHITKAKRLCSFRSGWDTLSQQLDRNVSSSAVGSMREREILVEKVDGFGFKEASHALRNIGRKNLAILDRHILKNLLAHGVIAKIPKTLNKRLYLEIESQFRDFALKVGEEMDALDLYFWAKETGEVYK